MRTAALSYDDLRAKADEFLRQHHPTGTVPVPIEQIVEFGFGINIIPLPGLHHDHDIDGLIASSPTEIFVDLFGVEAVRLTSLRERPRVARVAGVLLRWPGSCPPDATRRRVPRRAADG